MKNTIVFNIVIIVLIFIQYKTTQAQEQKYSIRVKDYEYNIKTHKSKNHGWIVKTAKITDDIEIILGFKKSGEGIYMATNAHLDLKQKLEGYINENYNSEKVTSNNNFKYLSKYAIYLRPMLDQLNNFKDVLMAIEQSKNIKGNLYKINDFILNKNELKNSKEFGHLRDGRSIYNVIKDNNDIKMLIHETPEELYYVSFEFSVENGSSKVSENNTRQFFPSNDIKTISAPFDYDIKYQNSKGEKTFLVNIKQGESFTVRVAKVDTINPVTKKKVSLIYNLMGTILPVKFLKNELTIRFILTGEDIWLDGSGNKTTTSHSTYIKEISLKPDDVVEIKLKDNWPKIQTLFGYDPTTLKKYYWDYKIKNQSFFLKPVKKSL
jgi:hypothetical protein